MGLKALKEGRVLVTGASAGIGEAFAREFAARGFKLVLVARSADKLDQLAQELRLAYSVEVITMPADLSDKPAAERLFKDCEDLPVDILVNNAGVLYHGEFSEQDLSSIDAIVQLNISGLTRLCRLFLQPMLARKTGRILNITSTTGFQAGPTVAVYAASKAYILLFTEALAEELRGSGVFATALAPGSTDTRMMTASFGEELRTDALGSLMMMSTQEVAAAGFKACMAGETVCVPGLANNVLNVIGRLQPRWLNRRMQSYMYRNFLAKKNKAAS